MIRKIDRFYELTAVEVRDAIFYWLANAKDYPVPSSYDDATITWDSTQKVYIQWMDTVAEVADSTSPFFECPGCGKDIAADGPHATKCPVSNGERA